VKRAVCCATLLAIGSAIIPCGVGQAAHAADRSPKPNIVILLADDLGWSDISIHHGSTPTPRIDRLFREGVELGNFMSCPLCSPTRGGLLTARHHLRIGAGPQTGGELDLGETTFAKAFRAHGYATGAFGKWHKRIYVTGLSMGGFGTWDLILRNPQLFAAAIPVCGGGDPSKADAIMTMPSWVFHGDADPTVPVTNSREMAAALKNNPHLRYTEYPGVGHNAWDKAWEKPGIVEWLFAQHKENGAVIGNAYAAEASENRTSAASGTARATSAPGQVETHRGKAPGAEAQVEVNADVLLLFEARDFRGMPYRLMKPIDFDAAKTYPLILSLHGAGGKGADNLRNLRNWCNVLAREELRRKHPCFVLAPQTTRGWSPADEKASELTEKSITAYPEPWQRFLKRWMLSKDSPLAKAYAGGDLSKVFDLVAEIQKEFRIDPDRIYVIGHSMGGVGTWNALYAKPEMFAAAIPTAGGLSPWKDPKRFAKVPIWAFHGSADPTVPVEFTRMLFEAMVQSGGNMKYTEMKGIGHGVPAWTYHGEDEAKGYITRYSSDRCDKEADVWDWLFKQKHD